LVPQVHFVWAEVGTDVEAETAARIAAGSAKPDDKFYSVAWRPADSDMHLPFAPPQRSAPPPANDNTWPDWW
jgi:hypothetical protein